MIKNKTNNRVALAQETFGSDYPDRVKVSLYLDPVGSKKYLFYSSKFGTFRSPAAWSDPEISRAYHQWLAGLLNDEYLAGDLDEWLIAVVAEHGED